MAPRTPPKFVPFYSQTFPNDPLGPDELMKPTPVLWPDTEVVPFHYEHPVTGQKWHAATWDGVSVGYRGGGCSTHAARPW